ncbi:SDR family oxidoreductase [Nonomuraea sp. NPDC046570]|uniref:SDR family NAD(P)-dependent oxidoreductase n=1 Tax=Nonomuraea sp. NPDC046570 TaxID=3155255 RepID=UPI0033D3EA58
MLLENKTAIVYGAAGGIGAGVARTFAREGARVFLAGRTLKKLEAVADGITAAGGRAEVAEVDVLDERAVAEHLAAVVAEAGGVDVTFNAVSHGDEGAGGYVQGVPMVDLPAQTFAGPVTTAVLTNFITAQAAARQMVRQGSGVILTLANAGGRSGPPLMGSTGVAAAAIESFVRYLATEVGPHGVRVLGVRIAGVPDSWGVQEMHTDVFDSEHGGMDMSGILQTMADATMLKKTTTLAQVADLAAFLASDRNGGMTATLVNLTGGMVAD